MRRRRIPILAVMSLALGLILAGLWGRSFWRQDGLFVRWNDRGARLESAAGRLSFMWVRYPIPLPRPECHWKSEPAAAIWPPRAPGFWGWLGFGRWHMQFDISSQVGRPLLTISDTVAVPHALPLLAAALLPGWWCWRRWRGRPPGACPQCGYDLRASPERCPECGMMVGRRELRT